MSGVVSKVGTGLLLVVLAVGGWLCQRGGEKVMVAGKAPSPAAEMIVAGLGGFRGLFAEVVWFRADRLQDEGRYAELAQLSAWLTFLEPHTPEVWAYSAWNLAYNISVSMPTPQDRWRWVEAGIRLLREDGLRLNPTEPALYRELSWMYLLKLGGSFDEAGVYYRSAWKQKVEELRKDGRLAEIGFDESRMAALDAEYGKLDWTNPFAAAIYWGTMGLEFAKTGDRHHELRQVVYQSLMMLARTDASFAPRALQEMRTAYVENPSPLLKQLIGKFRSNFGLD